MINKYTSQLEADLHSFKRSHINNSLNWTIGYHRRGQCFPINEARKLTKSHCPQQIKIYF